MRSMLPLAVAVALLAGCGGSGPDAPAVGDPVAVCTPGFCVDVPAGWEVVEETEEFVSLRHGDAPDAVMATVGPVSMEAVVEAAGGSWPQQPDAVVRSFWSIIDGGDAELATMTPQRDGSVESFGSFAGGRLWYRLVPLDISDGIGAEMRAPNATWAEHAATILGSVVPVP